MSRFGALWALVSSSLAALAPFAAAGAQGSGGPGTTSAVVLELPATARAVGLGGAYAAVVGDEGSVFVNPAGLAPIKRVALGLSYQRYLFDAYLASAAAAFRVGRFHLGVGAQVLDFGSEREVVPNPNFGGERGDTTGNTVTARDLVAQGAVAYRFGLLSFGTGVKYVQETIADLSAGTIGVDVGAAAALFDIAALGVVIQNLGGEIKTGTIGPAAPLPLTVRAGFTLNFVDPQGVMRLMATSDYVKPRGGDGYFVIGVEGGVVSGGMGVVGRAGLAAGRTAGADDRRSLTFGGGIVLGSLALDYGYQGFDALGSATHRIGLRWMPSR